MNTLKKQFSDSLKREGKIITTYYTNEEVKCLFRKVNDDNTKETSVIFYDINAPIKQGQLITYNGKQYLILNQETLENEIYYKSTIIKCNTVLEIVLNQRKRYIPCYAGDLGSSGLIISTTITTVDGKVELLTESTDLVNSIAYDTAFIILGGTYAMGNRYIKSGITYLYVERTTSIPIQEPVYAMTVTASNNSYEVGTTTTLTTSVTSDGVIVDNPVLVYSSSNESIATISSGGLITFSKIGSVTFTVTYADGNISKTIDLTVVPVPVVNTMSVVCSSTSNQITAGGTYRTFTATLMNGSGTVLPFTPVWTYNWNGMAASNFTITTMTPTITNTAKIKITVADNSSLAGKTFTVNCATSDGATANNVVITILY